MGSLHFGKILGRNKLHDVDVLFVIGTQNIGKNNLTELFEPWFREELEETEDEKMSEGGYHYPHNEELELLRKNYGDYEMYQGIYRARPGMREIEVYVFGRLPDSIKKEFDAKTIVIDHDRTREVALGLENFVYRILENEGEVKFDTIYERIKEEYHLKNRSAIYTVLNKIAKNNEDVSIGIIKENRVGRPSKSLTIKRIRR